jgi:hypothetical protein
MNARKLCQKACCARSVRCQLQDVLFVLLANDGEAAFLQDPDGAYVVLGNTRVEGAAYLHVANEYSERLRGDPLAPVLVACSARLRTTCVITAATISGLILAFHVLPAKLRFLEWAMLGSNQRPLLCEGSKAVSYAF